MLPAKAAPVVVINTAVITPIEGIPFLKMHTPIMSVTKGRHRLKTTYIGKLSPLRDHRVRVDCRVARIQTPEKTFANCRLNGGISTFPSLRRISRVSAAVLLVMNWIRVR